MSTAMPILETPRLLVRPFVEADLADATRVLNAAWSERLSTVEREPWLRWTIAAYGGLASVLQPPYGDRAIVLRETGAMMGVVGLVPSFGPFRTLEAFGGGRSPEDRLFEPAMGLYWAVDPAEQRKGYGAEAAGAVVAFAFERLGARVVVATTEFENEASQAVMRKLGMAIERNPYPEPDWFQAVGVLLNPAARRSPS